MRPPCCSTRAERIAELALVAAAHAEEAAYEVEVAAAALETVERAQAAANRAKAAALRAGERPPSRSAPPRAIGRGLTDVQEAE
jgi:hypothetical protein